MNSRMHSIVFAGLPRAPADWTAGRLAPGTPSAGPVDLSAVGVVVPTRAAARRLRDALAVRAAAFGSGLFAPTVMTPGQWVGRVRPGGTANETRSLMAWIGALKACPEEPRRVFAPSLDVDDPALLAGLAEKLRDVRAELADGGLDIRRVAKRDDLEEPERWRALGVVESLYLREMADMGFPDPEAFRRTPDPAPLLDAGIERIVLAFTLDPALSLLRLLEKLEAAGVAVEVFVPGPASWRERFDRWGRPRPEAWNAREIDIPDPENNLLLSAGPQSQAEKVIDLLRENRDRFARGEVATGLPDSETARYLSEKLAAMGIELFDPAPRPLHNTGVFRAVDRFLELRRERSYESLAAFLRHGDVLAALAAEDSAALLESLDTFQNAHLPLSLDEMRERLTSPSDPDLGDSAAPGLARLKSVLDGVEAWLSSSGRSFSGALRTLLEAVYHSRDIHPGNPRDRDFVQAAEAFDRVLREIESVESAPVSESLLETLFRARLREQTWQPERERAPLAAEGWLELQWNPAPLMIVAGMNEGVVPDSRLGDLFLPDSLRSRLGLRNDRERLARDAALLTLLIETRRAGEGRCCLLLSKTSRTGEPMRPSRLLFRGPDAELPARAGRLFGPADDPPAGRPATVAFKLDPARAGPPPAERLRALSSLSVSAFSAYLRCPLRFYFEFLCQWRRVTDECFEPDALAFGSLMHEALETLGRDPRLWKREDPESLAAALYAVFRGGVRRKYGAAPPLGVEVALSAARERLGAFARVHVDEVRRGWELQAVESRITLEVAGLPLHGRVDRIERHRESGRLRVLDYKTSDQPAEPRKQHLAGGPGPLREIPAYAVVPPEASPPAGRRASRRRWQDLQLPLYAEALGRSFDFEALDLGYAVLPKAVSDTGIRMWTDYGRALHASAMACAEGVVRDIRRGRFWPPSRRGSFGDDPYDLLFPADEDRCLASETLRGSERAP